jgi:hypothetical protein
MQLSKEGPIMQLSKEENTKKGQTIIYETLHRKLKIEQHEPHKNGIKLMCS